MSGDAARMSAYATGLTWWGEEIHPSRTDAQGRVYYLTSAEQLLFDPAGATSGAQYKVTSTGRPTQSTAGNFADALEYDWFNTLTDERGTYARGIGFVSSSTQ